MLMTDPTLELPLPGRYRISGLRLFHTFHRALIDTVWLLVVQGSQNNYLEGIHFTGDAAVIPDTAERFL
jgi:hypothetical protein